MKYYIVHSEKIIAQDIQIENYPSNQWEFKKGFYILEDECDHFYGYKSNNVFNMIKDSSDSEIILLSKNLMFTNKEKAQAVFLKLKVEEMISNGADILLHKTFKAYQEELHEISINNPEYLI